MEDSNTFVIGVTIDQLQTKILFNIKGQFMRKINTNAYFALKQDKKEIFKNTKSLCMMESNTPANIAAIKQLQAEI